MAKRQSKRLLVGLGSTVASATVVAMSGFGLNGLLRVKNLEQSSLLNMIQPSSLSQFPNFQTPNAQMFIPTENLNSFHFGNVRRGQTLTPYGWLGVYNDDPDLRKLKNHRLALTAWNGEILWVYDGVQANTDPISNARNVTGNIYDVKYDFNTDLITIIYTDTSTGLFNPQDANGHTYIEIIDAKTGRQLPGWKPLNISSYWGQPAGIALRDKFLLSNVSNDPNSGAGWRALDLYKLDVTSRRGGNSNLMLIQYAPTYNQLHQGTYDNSITTLVPFGIVLETFGRSAWFDIVDKTRANWWQSRNLDVKTWLSQIGWLRGNTIEFNGLNNQKSTFDITKSYLLTDPYVTPGSADSEWFIHFFVGDQTGKTYHLALNFTFTTSTNPAFNSGKSKAESISDGGLNFSVNVANDHKWYENALYYNKAMIATNPANMRVNKNIFNPNLATWAYPYASVGAQNQGGSDVIDNGGANAGKGTGWLIYNVAQILINEQTGLVDRQGGPRQTRNYDLGKQILAKWNGNNAAKVQPWPNPSKAHPHARHNFNRLVSVSPFDNSFVYSAMANFQTPNSYTDTSDNFKSYWLFNSNTDSMLNAIPFLLGGNRELSSKIDSTAIEFNQLEVDGFSWDLESAINNRTKLYLNHSGTGANSSDYNQKFKSPTSKIFVVNGIDTSVRISNFMGNFQNVGDKTFSITNDQGPYGIIHSRAKLDLWYNLTQASFENPTNMISNQGLLNNGTSGGQVAIGPFDKMINIESGKNVKDYVDVVTHLGQTSILSISNPEIKLVDNGGSRTVRAKVRFTPIKSTLDWYRRNLNIDSEAITYVIDHQIPNTSVQLFSKIGTDFKFTSLPDRFGTQTPSRQPVRVQQITSSQWFDVRKYPTVQQPFGQINNNLQNGRFPLRILLQLVKPANAPSWMTNFDPKVWLPTAVDSNKTPNESSFQDVLNQYMNDLLANISNTDLTPWGLGNLRIRATIGLNPLFSQDQKIYQLANNKQMILGQDGSVYVFDDQHKIEDTLVYDQSAPTYATMQQYGYGSMVHKKIANNWVTVPNNQKFLVDAPLNKLGQFKGLLHPIVRRGVSFADETPLFNLRFKPGTLTLSAVRNEPNERAWLKNLLSTINFKYGLFTIVEGLKGTQWVNLKPNGGHYTDEDFVKFWNETTGGFLLPTQESGFAKVRLRLTYQNWQNLTNNDYVLWEPQPLDAYDNKFLSWAHPINTTDVVIDKTWFNVPILKSNNFLDQLDEQALIDYQNAIKTEFIKVNKDLNLWDKVDLVWIFDGQTHKTNSSLISAIKKKTTAYNDPSWNYGFWSLWNGNLNDAGGKKIRAQFEIKPPFAGQIQLIDKNGNGIVNVQDRSGDVKAHVKTKVDVSTYLNDLQAQGVNATPKPIIGELQNVSLPTLSSSARPWNLPYQTIAMMLDQMGIAVEFQGQSQKGTWSGLWVRDVNQISTYLPNQPKLKIRASLDASHNNSALWYGGQEVDANNGFGKEGIEIRINVPKLVVNPNQFDQFLQNEINTKTPFGGNTWKLVTNVNAFEQAITSKLIQSSDSGNSGSHNNLNRYISYQYQLGNGQFFSADELVKELLKNTTDQPSNQIKIKLLLSPQNEFILDPDLAKPIVVLSENNTIVKKWIHGREQEQALKQITVSGNRQHIQYHWPLTLQPYINTDVNNVSLQWTYGGKNNQKPDHNFSGWQNNQITNFPTDLSGPNNGIRFIYVRLKHNDTDSIYQYGPEVENHNWGIGAIDLSQIKFLLTVNNDWFSQSAITTDVIDLATLDRDLLEAWKVNIWDKSNIDDDLKQFVDIEFQVFDQNWVNSDELLKKIQSAQRDYTNGVHYGIVSLWDPSSSSGLSSLTTKIKARFVKKPLAPLDFIDGTNSVITDPLRLQGDVNTANIQTTIDLSYYFSVLTSQQTIVTTNGQPGTIKKLEPPANSQGAHLFTGKTFSEIATILGKFGINFVFASDLQNNPNRLWSDITSIKVYDANVAKLAIALTNNSSNLKIKWDQTSVDNIIDIHHDNKNANVLIPLQAPKTITIESSDYVGLEHAFSGNTKNISVDLKQLNDIIDQIKRRHAQQNPIFAAAPLDLQVKIGNEPFTDFRQVASVLKNKTTDLDSRSISIKFVLNNVQNDEWNLIGDTEQEIVDDNRNLLKIYINDQNIKTELRNQTTFAGTSHNIIWNWPPGYQVNPSTGLLIHQSKGKGLKLEFSFDSTLDPVTGATGSDPYKTWVSSYPTSFDPNKLPDQKVFVRFNVSDKDRYIAQEQNVKFELTLNLKTILQVDAKWFEQPLLLSPKWIGDLELDDFRRYEASVRNQMLGWSDENKDKVQLQYHFRGQNYSSAELVQQIENLRNDVNHLQLWNGSAGDQIKVTFIKTQSGGNYDLEWINTTQTSHIINTESVNTRIDFSEVAKWLKRIKLNFTPGTKPNSIDKIVIPNVDATNSKFNSLSWDQVVAILKNMQIKTQYRQVSGNGGSVNNNPWNENLSAIKEFDKRGQFQIRFVLDNPQAINVKLSLFNDSIQGTNAAQLDSSNVKWEADPIVLNLQTPLIIELPQTYIDQFIAHPGTISGNTHDIAIAAQAEEGLVQAILAYNHNLNPDANPSYNNANLQIQYAIGQNPAESAWAPRDQFIANLKATPTDQNSNQIQFRFVVQNRDSNHPDFSVANTAYTLNAHTSVNQTNEQTKIKYFIHNGDWETNADKVTISGSNNKMLWNFSGAFGTQVSDLDKVTLKSAGGHPLIIQFTTSSSATYQDAVDFNHTDIKTGWITAKPAQIEPGSSVLKIRIVPINSGVYYEAKELNQAKVHNIDLSNLRREIIIDKSWLVQSLTVANQNQVKHLSTTDLDQYEAAVLNNFTDSNLKPQLVIKYRIANQSNLNKDQVVELLTQILTQPTTADLGVVHLWNQSAGLQLEAYFDLAAGSNSSYVLVDQATNNVIQPEATVQVINTSQIISQIDFSAYIAQLKAAKIAVQLGNGNNTIQSINWPAHAGAANQQFGTKSLGEILAVFAKMGLTMQVRYVPIGGNLDAEANWVAWNQLHTYDPNTNKIELRFNLDPDKGKNVQVLLAANQSPQLDGTSNTLKSPPITLSLDAPLKFVINSQWINDFKAKVPIRGNTKYLKINETAETDLIETIFQANIANNGDFAAAKNNFQVLYTLGNGHTNANWATREAFIQALQQARDDQLTNAISIKLVVKNEAQPAQQYQVDEHITTIVDEAIGDAGAPVKIYINEAGYEALASQITIRGTNNRFTWNYPPQLRPNDDGTFSNIKGLRIQWSTKKGITNSAFSTTNTDPAKGWVNTPPRAISASERYLAVQLVAGAGYEYAPQYKHDNPNAPEASSQWQVHAIDVANIKSEISLDPSVLQQLIWTGTTDQLAQATIQQLEQQLIQNAVSDGVLQTKLQIQYQITWGAHTLVAWSELSSTIQQLSQWVSDFSGPTAGLIKFNGWGATQFATVQARFVSTDPNFVVVDKQGQWQPDQGVEINASQVQTKIDLSAYTKVLQSVYVVLAKGSTQDNLSIRDLPSMPPGGDFLGGYQWAAIKKLLSLMGLEAQFRAPGITNGWTTLDQIRALNQNNELQLRWVINPKVLGNATGLADFSKTILLKTTSDQNLDASSEYASSPINLRVNLPIKINTDHNVLSTKLASQFSGNTYILRTGNAAAIVQQLIQEVIATNQTPGNVPLKIHFSLNGRPLAANQVWFELNDFVNALAAATTNWQTNEIRAKFVIANPVGALQEYEISDEQEAIVSAENNAPTAAVKKWIHNGKFWTNITTDLRPVGTTQAYTFPNYAAWSATLPVGLTLQLNHLSASGSDSNWVNFDINQLPKPLNPDKQLWARLTVSGAYQFEAITTGAATESQLLDSSQLKAVLALQSAWIALLQTSGKLNKLVIDESPFYRHLQQTNVLPTGKDNLLQLQYQVGDGQWLTKTEFEAHLQALNGAKDTQRWILMHKDLHVRFAINPADPDAHNYLLAIDGTIDDPDQSTNTYALEPQVKGVINANKLLGFVKDNFYIIGTNNAPKFSVANRTVIDQLISQYASEALFDIQFSTEFDPVTQTWRWRDERSLINSSRTGLIDEEALIQQQIQIGSDRKFAIRLVAKDSNYQVEHNDHEQSAGYFIDLSDQIRITFEIENPFAKNNKTLAIQTRGTNNEAIWEQGQGQFRIVVGNLQYQPEAALVAAQTYLSANLPVDQSEHLEFVYRIFASQPTADEIAQASAKASINDYSSTSLWQTFAFGAGADGNYWSQNLKLKVGNYLMVALRVKQTSATGPNPYRLKDDQFSVLIPVHGQSTPGRVAGYLVDPNQAPVVSQSVTLFSQNPKVKGLLDGWSQLEGLSLALDEADNASGIDLTLNFYNAFHLDQSGRVLISGSGAKLVQREQANMHQGQVYVDLDGNPIRDHNGQLVYLWTDPQTHRLANPTESAQPTQSLSLTSREFGNYTLDQLPGDPNLVSLFRNQKLTLTYKAKVGLGTADRPDYVLKQAHEFDLTPIVSPQIKFAIENPQNIVYEWANRAAFSDDKVEFEAVNGETKPIEGLARVKTITMLERRRRNESSATTTITGANGFEAARNIAARIREDFGGQLQFNYTHIKKQGGQSTVTNSANFYDLTNLHNGDRIIVELKATADDQIYTDAPEPLAILVSGLAVDAPDASLLQWLRVEQGGTTNGTGSFRVLVHNPNGAYQDPKDYLRGWKFLVRVWDGAKQEVKIDWTDEQAMLTGLSNGDRVEWKLVDQDNNPVQDAYYNTVALRHEVTNPDGTVKFNFGQVDYSDGPNSQRVIQVGIGDYPPKDQADHFPSTSGFTIAGLQEQSRRFDLQPLAFAKIIETLGPFYRGQNGNGALNFNHQYFEGLWYVNLAGELYQTPRYPEQDLQTPQEIPLSQFLNHTTFFTQDPTLNPAQVGFKFMTNATNTGNYLSNGDQVWAQFNSVVNLDADLKLSQSSRSFRATSYDDNSAVSYVYQLPDVSGLDHISDPMHPLWWLLIVLAGLATLGIAWFVIWRQRYRKLRVE